MPYIYKMQQTTAKDIESDVRYWTEKGYKLHNVVSAEDRYVLGDPSTVLVAILRKSTRKKK